MKVSHYPNKITKKRTALVLGSFETIHNGHFELIKEARKTKLPIAIMLIENIEAIPGNSRKAITSLDARLFELSKLGIKYVSVIKLTPGLTAMPGKEFMEKLVNSVNAKKLFCGKDFGVGLGGKYKAIDIANDYSLTVVDFIKVNNKKISSTLIYELTQLGDFGLLKDLSPLPYCEYVRFDHEKKIVDWNNEKIQPGIYACAAIVNDIRYWATLHIKQDGVMQAYIPDLQVKNQSFNALLEFYKQVRVIVSSKKDVMTEDDKYKAAITLKNNFEM